MVVGKAPCHKEDYSNGVFSTTMTVMAGRLVYMIVLPVLMAAPGAADGKERHFEQLRVLLISKAARCNSCHVGEAGQGLNAYGERLHALSQDDSLADRIAMVEADPRVGATESERLQKQKDQDVDQDGVPNWVEILAGNDPADAEDRPKSKKVRRIERVVSCTSCHEATNLPGKDGLAANPHNALGALLSKTYELPPRRAKPKTSEAVQTAAERTPILTRIAKIKKKKPRKSKATYWQKLRLLHSPADPEDNPKPKTLKRFKKKAAVQRSKRKRDPTLGLACDAHPADGFLTDAEGLD